VDLAVATHRSTVPYTHEHDARPCLKRLCALGAANMKLLILVGTPDLVMHAHSGSSRLNRGPRARTYCKNEKTGPMTGTLLRPFEAVAGALFRWRAGW